jgi:uncharacterized protein (DUF2141 family)
MTEHLDIVFIGLSLPENIVFMKLFTLSIFLFGSFYIRLFSQTNGTLQIEASPFRNAKGAMRFAIYSNKTHFLDTKGYFALGEATIIGNKSNSSISLPPGTYAVSFLHDENNDKKMEYTLGIPREGFGISNLKSFPLGKPAYEKSLVTIESGKTTYIPIKVFYFF